METRGEYNSRHKRVLLKPDKYCNMRPKKCRNTILKLCHESLKICEVKTSVVIQISGISRVNKQKLSVPLMFSETISIQCYIYIPSENVFSEYKNGTLT